MNLSKIEIVSSDEIPNRGRSSIDFTPLFRKVALLREAEERVKLPIEKSHYVGRIQSALNRKFRHSQYKAFQRTIDGQLHCVIKIA